MKEYDNFPITALQTLLQPDVLPARYAALLPLETHLRETLRVAGLTDKYACLSVSETELAAITGLPAQDVRLFAVFLHLYDFRERKLSELAFLPPDTLRALSNAGIHHSSQYLALCLKDGLPCTAKCCGMELPLARKLLSFCDLMRLPGVKLIRADLYYTCNLPCIDAFVGRDAKALQAALAAVIREKNLPQTLPLPKELRTQIAVATALPKLYRQALG